MPILRPKNVQVRPASHAGTWYTDDKDELSRELDGYLANVISPTTGIRPWSQTLPIAPLPRDGARVIIAPHAGYLYSGPTAAWAYQSLDLSNTERIFLLGPSHHRTEWDCRLTTFTEYETPFGNLVIDRETTTELHTGNEEFISWMDPEDDIKEHSLEMHLPYIYKMLSRTHPSRRTFPKLIPLLIGPTHTKEDRRLGKLLAPYLHDPTTAFIISSDFCHWGRSFAYTRLIKGNDMFIGDDGSEIRTSQDIMDGIAGLDHRSMDAIETGEYNLFVENILRTKNTICGSHPIRVMMAAFEERMEKNAKGGESDNWCKFQFIRYERSCDHMSLSESSVSYCSAFAVV